ncbi:MAG: hypothetical protein LBO05_08740 [Deltaproteobacteria bacterium]|jgi:TPR repeat protein|nr:hypothetical protein [Deltaproteobacteria bacterium]
MLKLLSKIFQFLFFARKARASEAREFTVVVTAADEEAALEAAREKAFQNAVNMRTTKKDRSLMGEDAAGSIGARRDEFVVGTKILEKVKKSAKTKYKIRVLVDDDGLFRMLQETSKITTASTYVEDQFEIFPAADYHLRKTEFAAKPDFPDLLEKVDLCDDLPELVQIAESGDPGTIAMIAELIMRGDGVMRDLEKVAALTGPGVAAGESGALTVYGMLRHWGDYFFESVKCLQLASVRDHGYGYSDFLSHVYLSEITARIKDEQDREASVKAVVGFFQGNAADGRPEAQAFLGHMYRHGLLVGRDLAKADKWLRASAARGYCSAQYSLGVDHLFGNGQPENRAEAVRFLKLAAAQGYRKALHTLAQLSQLGIDGIPRDKAEAVRLYRLASHLNYPPSQYNLALALLSGDGVEKDADEGLLSLQLAAVNGLQIADDLLRKLREEGALPPLKDSGEQPETPEAGLPPESAAPTEQAPAGPEQTAEPQAGPEQTPETQEPADIAESAENAKIIKSASESTEKTSSEQASAPETETETAPDNPPETAPDAPENVENAAPAPPNAPKDPLAARRDEALRLLDNNEHERAAAIFDELAEQGSADAQYRLARLYFLGRGVARDDGLALKWYGRAAEQGLPGAQNILATMHYNGLGTPKDYRKASEWYRRAAEQGLYTAQFDLATMCDEGLGVKQDSREAVKWYRLAADQGFAAAQFNLAVMLDEGRGAPRDREEALRLYRLSAEQGLAPAQYELGQIYLQGEKTAADVDEARKWLQLAAFQGHPEAREKLENL